MFVGKFKKTVDISYNIENFKAKVSNVHDDKHLAIKMSTSRGHARWQTRANYRFFLVILFFLQKKVFLRTGFLINYLFRTNMLHAFLTTKTIQPTYPFYSIQRATLCKFLALPKMLV